MNFPELPPWAPEPRYRLTTKEFADQFRAREQTVRKQHATTGAYCGVRPLKLPNGHLRWPEGAVERLAAEKLGDAK